jgi:hypothetical protein
VDGGLHRNGDHPEKVRKRYEQDCKSCAVSRRRRLQTNERKRTLLRVYTPLTATAPKTSVLDFSPSHRKKRDNEAAATTRGLKQLSPNQLVLQVGEPRLSLAAIIIIALPTGRRRAHDV